MKNNNFIKKLFSAILFCLVSSIAFGEGTPDLCAPVNDFEGTSERAHSHDNALHHSADVVINGTIRDEKGALSGATIRENGTNNVTTTKGDGTFSLKVSKPNAVLTISFVGYESSEIALEGRTIVNVILKTSSQELQRFRD